MKTASTFDEDKPVMRRWLIRWITNAVLAIGMSLGLVAAGISLVRFAPDARRLAELTPRPEETATAIPDSVDGKRTVGSEASVTEGGTDAGNGSEEGPISRTVAILQAFGNFDEEEKGAKGEGGAATADSMGDEGIQVASRGPIEPPVSEIPGAVEEMEQHVPEHSSAPEEILSDCERHFPVDLDDAMRITAMDGPIKCNFTVEFDGYLNSWTLLTVPRLPGDMLSLMVVEPHDDAEFELEVAGGEIVTAGAHSWNWRAPEEPGIYCVRISEHTRDEAMCFHVAVMKPWNDETVFNGFRIGDYQDKPFRDNPRYQKPRGFIEITQDMEDTWLSPHFQVKQFLCKQEGGYPKYLLIEPRLLIKLEMLIERLEGNGIEAERLFILSGFRTPWYNEAIGNKTYYSRHLYGDAADLFVDMNGDGMMDDLDRDGHVSGADAKVLHYTIEKITEENADLVGGLGFYDNINYRNPFIHVDTRGYEARWYK